MSKSSALLCILKDISLYTVLRFLLTDKRTSQLIQRKESFEKSLFAVAKFLFLSFGKKFLFLEVKKKKKGANICRSIQEPNFLGEADEDPSQWVLLVPFFRTFFTSVIPRLWFAESY